jgi:hypothetical protein
MIEPIINWGFDLTGFDSAETFEKILKHNGLLSGYRRLVRRYAGEISYVYSWKNSDVEIRTGNNPITGKYSQPRRRETDKGYASYIGIRGKQSAVLKLVKDIKSATNDIKEENPNENPYIW